MKKCLMALCWSLLIIRTQATEAISYEVDPVATTSAPWKVGDKTVESNRCTFQYTDGGCYTIFHGVTTTGTVLLQDYYVTGEKFSDIYETISFSAAEEELPRRVLSKDDSYAVGIVSQYFKNGQKMIEVNYQNGKANGSWREWWPTGQLLLECHYKNGQWHGLQTTWDEQGKIISVESYQEDIRHGTFEKYSNGQKIAKITYKNGSPTGIGYIWNEDGSLKKTIDFDTE